MKEYKNVKLNTVEKVKNFVNEISRIEEDVDIASGRYKIDAKSIMGIFSLDISKPITVTVNSDNPDSIAKADAIVAKYI